VGLGVGLQPARLGRIIELVPTKTQSSFRLSDSALEELQRLAEKLGKARPDVVELAISHLSGTLAHDQPVYIGPPPDAPKSHKRRSHAA
jgi:hypothetical protein